MKYVLLALLCWACREPGGVEQRALAAHVFEDGDTIVMWSEAQTYWIASYDKKLRRSWASQMEGMPTIHAGNRYPMVIAQDTISILTQEPRDGMHVFRVESFARRKGARVASQLGTTQAESSPVEGFAFGGHTFHYFDGELVMLDPSNGVEIRRAPVPFEPDRVFVRGDRWVLQNASVEATVASNGEVRADGTRGCLIDGRVWKLAASGERYALVPIEGEPASITLDFVGEHAAIEYCATYGSKVVAFLNLRPAGQDDRRELWIIEKDGRIVGRVATDSRPPRTYSADRLPRFLPVLEQRAVSLVDLELGRATWRIDTARTRVLDPVLVEGRWYLTDESSTPELAIIDANTGKLQATEKLGRRSGMLPLGPENFGGNRLILLRAAHATSADPMASILSLPSLTHIAGAPIDVSHVSSLFTNIPRN